MLTSATDKRMPNRDGSMGNVLKNKYKYSSKNIDKYFVKNSNTSIKYFFSQVNFSQVQSSTSNVTFMFHSGDGQGDENTKAPVYAWLFVVP